MSVVFEQLEALIVIAHILFFGGLSGVILSSTWLLVHLYRVHKYGEDALNQNQALKSVRRSKSRQIVIAALAKARGPMSGVDLCEVTGLGPGTIFPTLSSLCIHGLLTEDTSDEFFLYSLNHKGYQLFELLQQSDASG